MHCKWKLLFGGVLLTCLSWPCQAQTDAALSIDAAMLMSVQNQPYLRQDDAGHFALTELRFLNVDLPVLAPFKTAIENYRRERDPLTRDIVSLGDSFLTSDERMAVRMKRVRMVIHDAEMVALSREIARDAAFAWLKIYEAQHAIGLEQAMQSEYANEVRLADISYRAGKGSQSDIWKAEDEQHASRAREIELKNQAAAGKAELQRWIGEKPFVLDEKIELKAVPPFEELCERVPGLPQQSRYALAKEIAEEEIKLAESAYKPDPKTAFHPQENILTALRALRDKITFQAINSLRVLKSEMSVAYADWQTTQERYKLQTNSIVPAAAARLQAALLAYGNGKADFAAVLDAERYDINARMQQLHLQVAVAKARIQLGLYE